MEGKNLKPAEPKAISKLNSIDVENIEVDSEETVTEEVKDESVIIKDFSDLITTKQSK